MKKLLIIIFILTSSIAIGQQTKFAQRSDVKIGDSATNTASWIGKYASPYWVWTNYLGKGDTVLIVATKYDLDTLASNIVYNESDPIFALDSANILHWYDSVLRIATKYDLDTLAANIVYIETDPVYALDSGSLLHWYDTIIKIATKYNIDTLTFLRTESDPVFAIDSAALLHWNDSINKIATKYDIDTLAANIVYTETDPIFTSVTADAPSSALITIDSASAILTADSGLQATVAGNEIIFKNTKRTLASLDEKSYNSLTDKPTIPTQWTTSGSNIYYTTGNVSIGNVIAVNPLTTSGFCTTIEEAQLRIHAPYSTSGKKNLFVGYETNNFYGFLQASHGTTSYSPDTLKLNPQGGEVLSGENIMLTVEGGYAVKMIAGCSLEQGDVVCVTSAGTVTKTSSATVYNSTIGVAYNTASASGSVYVVVNGRALVKFTSQECNGDDIVLDEPNAGNYAAVGQVFCDNTPYPNMGEDGKAVNVTCQTGFQIIGVILETKSAGQSAYVMLTGVTIPPL